MKICCLIPRLTYSGAPKIMAWLAKQLATSGNDVSILTIFKHERFQGVDSRINVMNFDFVQSTSHLKRNTTDMLRNLIAIHRYVIKERPDIVISFLDSAGLLYLLVNRIFKKTKMVVSERSDPFAYKKLTAPIRTGLLEFADGIVFQTDGARDYFYGRTKKRSIVIPNPVIVSKDIMKVIKTKAPNFSQRNNRIVSVGRMSIIQKRQDLLLEAFVTTQKRFPEMELHFYGEGQDMELVKSKAAELGIPKNQVIFHGRVDNVASEIYQAKMFVLSSDFEGIPNALIEAMLLGVPTVATDCSPGGARLLIVDGVNGYLVPRGDMKALSDAMINILSSPSDSDAFSKESKTIADKFSEQSIAKQWSEYLLKILKDCNRL